MEMRRRMVGKNILITMPKNWLISGMPPVVLRFNRPLFLSIVAHFARVALHAAPCSSTVSRPSSRASLPPAPAKPITGRTGPSEPAP